MMDQIEELGNSLEVIALEVVTLENGDIPAMGKIINVLEELEEKSGNLEEKRFVDLVRATKGYLERLILLEVKELKPLETGITTLQSFHRSLLKGERKCDEIINFEFMI